MENSSLGSGAGNGGMYSGKNPAMLGLDIHQLHPSSVVSYLPHEPQQAAVAVAAKYPLNPSDDEEPGEGEGKKKGSPWQRMKWTDMMVRLLITAVFYIGDESGGASEATEKKKAGGVLQKKGKWKSVSRAMMEKGFYVSPQQCEDKFNDLNKRYKRVNDILGKGTACKVVENQTLLETMELTPKIKEEVRKLLNSKHLFFREMCAYHNTCRHGSGSGSGLDPSPDTVPVPRAMAEEEEWEESETEEESGESETERRKRMRVEAWGAVEEGGRSGWEKEEWVKRRLVELEELQVKYEGEGLEMERQRLKWDKYRSKKEREMERGKLENQKKRLENERMVLMLKQKELELMEIHHFQQQQHSSSKRGDPSSVTG